MLELYQIEDDLHCRNVRQVLSDWEIDYIARSVPKVTEKRTQLMRISGQAMVPTLVDSAREVTIAGDEQKILDYLKQYYKPQGEDATKQPPAPDIKGYA